MAVGEAARQTEVSVMGTRQKKRDTYKYLFKRGNRILHGGITNDLDRREQEHQRTTDPKGHIRQVGRRTTEDAGRDWERKKGFTP